MIALVVEVFINFCLRKGWCFGFLSALLQLDSSAP